MIALVAPYCKTFIYECFELQCVPYTVHNNALRSFLKQLIVWDIAWTAIGSELKNMFVFDVIKV